MTFIRRCKECEKAFVSFKNYVVCGNCRFNCDKYRETPQIEEKMMSDGVKTFGTVPDTGFNTRISALETLSRSLILRICALEDARDKRAFDEHTVKSQATAAQATQHLYAPLRSDTKPLLEMSAFVRKMAQVDTLILSDAGCVLELAELAAEAAELVKRHT